MTTTPAMPSAASVPTDGALARLGPARTATLLVAALTAFKLLLAPRVGLVTDEAHYALYALHLDWSYFDHPPLVGWLQALVLPFSHGEFALRLWPIALSALSCALLYSLVRRLFPDESPWTATVAVALWASAPTALLTGMGLVPESVLLPVALLVAHATISVLRRGNLRQWLLLGVTLGLAGLSKYTAVTLVATVGGALLWSGRASDLRGAGPWLALLVAAALVAPVVFWNATHDWISFRYQLHHGTSGHGWRLVEFLRSRAAEFLACGPALAIGGAVAGWQGLRRERADPGVRLVLLLAVPVLLVFWIPSGRELSLPHWTQLAWAALSVLAARWFVGGWSRRWRRVLAAAGAAWCALVLALVAVVLGGLPAPAAVLRLRGEFVGWDAAAALAVKLRDGIAATPGPAPTLFVDNWTHASRLAFYGRPAPVQVLDDRIDQFDLWFGSPQPGSRGVCVAWDDSAPPDPARDLAHFDRHELLAELPVMQHGVRVATFRFWDCDGWHP